MTEKITGYLLLIIGIIFVILPAFSVYQVCTGKIKPYPLFNMNGISIDISSQIAAAQPSLNLSPDVLKALKITQTPTTTTPTIKPTEIIPAALINDSSNIFIHILLMGFIAGMGQKIASLGVQLLKPVEVKLSSSQKTLLDAAARVS